jgi:hypothetical protein
MKKFFYISGIIFWTLILIGAVYFVFNVIRGFRLDASSKTYVDKYVPIIISTWSEQELLKCGSSEFKTAVSNPEKQKFFDQTWNGFTKLGTLKEYNGSEGQSHQNLFFYTNSKRNGYHISAEYIADADFQNGSAKITIDLVQENGEWKIYFFSVHQ